MFDYCSNASEFVCCKFALGFFTVEPPSKAQKHPREWIRPLSEKDRIEPTEVRIEHLYGCAQCRFEIIVTADENSQRFFVVSVRRLY